jgi:ribonucleoside-diphosphate reductase alpha chain
LTNTGPSLPISKEIHATKYRLQGESFEACCARLASALSDNDEHRHALVDIFSSMRFMPAGRVQAAVGSPLKVTPWNCFVSGAIADDFNDIMEKAQEAGQTMRLGGGIGYDFSTLRPRGSLIKSLNSYSSGPVSFMDIYDALCGTIASAGHRRGAQMGVLRVDHPDIEEFVHAKQNEHKLTRFNISVAATDAFMKAVKHGTDFNLKFRGKVYKTVDARSLWNSIMRNTWDYAEPGILYIDRINYWNNLWYCEQLTATNPCVIGSTEILTKEHGYREIESLVGEVVNVWNGFEWSKVIPRVTGLDQDILDITTSNGRKLTCTKYHKFILSDGSRKEAHELQIGDKLLKHEWPRIGDMKEGPMIDFLSGPYTQGFFSGDGWEDSRGRQYIGLYDKKRELESFLETPLTRNEYDSKNENKKVYLYYGKSGKLRPKLFVPDTRFTLKYRLHWLAGLADSDGYLTEDGCLQISSKNKEFLVNVALMLNTLSVTGSISEMRDCWRLSISANHAYNLGLPTKRLSGYRKPDRDASRFITITSIEEAGKADKVYCFNEPLRNSAIFNGILTGQCAEQPLPPYGACLLGSFNLVKYIKDREFDFITFSQDIQHVVRAMDNIIDIGIYPLPQQEQEGKAKRRMGLGVTGFANTLEYLGYEYGSPDFLEFSKIILKILRDFCYSSSVELAKEKGAFPVYDKRYLDSKFIQTLPKEIIENIAKYGIRNSHLTSIAPTGTISLAADNISSGIEPVYTYSYTRTIQTMDGVKYEDVEDYGYRTWGITGKTANQLSPEEHVNVLTTTQKYVDSSVSKTCNVGSDVNFERFQNIYMMAYDNGAKGCTTFRAAGMRKGILQEKPSKEYIDDEDEMQVCVIDPVTGQPTCS